MQTNNLSKHAQYSTAELEQLLSELSDQSEVNSVLTELSKRYQTHYSKLVGNSDTSSSNASSRLKSDKSKESKPEPQPNSIASILIEQLKRQSLTEPVGRQGLRLCLTLLLAALFPIWLIRVFIHPILTLSKLVRLVVATLSILIVLIISIIVAPLKLLLLLITYGKVNLFEELFISKSKDLYDWVAPNGFWKDE